MNSRPNSAVGSQSSRRPLTIVDCGPTEGRKCTPYRQCPLQVCSSNKARHRLSRTGNRRLNAALHRIALTQARWHPRAGELLAHRKAGGDGGMEALRILRRRLSDHRLPGSDRRSQNLCSPQHARPRRSIE